jgi:hypothetical protein
LHCSREKEDSFFSILALYSPKISPPQLRKKESEHLLFGNLLVLCGQGDHLAGRLPISFCDCLPKHKARSHRTSGSAPRADSHCAAHIALLPSAKRNTQMSLSFFLSFFLSKEKY